MAGGAATKRKGKKYFRYIGKRSASKRQALMTFAKFVLSLYNREPGLSPKERDEAILQVVRVLRRGLISVRYDGG